MLTINKCLKTKFILVEIWGVEKSILCTSSVKSVIINAFEYQDHIISTIFFYSIFTAKCFYGRYFNCFNVDNDMKYYICRFSDLWPRFYSYHLLFLLHLWQYFLVYHKKKSTGICLFMVLILNLICEF